MSSHLLPSNAAPRERALAEACGRLSAVPVPIRDLWNPDDCPEPLLPWLAWALHVDGWDASWTEKQKREAIKASVWIHRHKGTRGAVDRAIAVLGYRARIREWWEEDPQAEPYTFSIEIEVDDRGVDAGLYGMLTRSVMAAKNTRSHLSGFSVASTTRGAVPVCGVTAVGHEITVHPWTPDHRSVPGEVLTGGAVVLYQTITINPGG